MKRFLLCCVATLALSGCLLDQTDPAPTTEAKKPYLGIVTVEDMTISNQGQLAMLNAYFDAKPEEKTKPVGAALASFEGRGQAVMELQADQISRAPICEKNVYLKEPQSKKPEKPAKLDLGKLAFGPALQSTFMILEPDPNPNNKNFYQSRLEANIPAGAYMMLTDGTPQYEGFKEYFSVPEQVFTLRLDGKDFGNPTYEFKPKKGLTLFWKEPAITNDQNGILLELMAEDDKYYYDVFCQTAEENILSASGYKEWEIPANWFGEFPTEGKVDFYFLRSHLYIPEYKSGTRIAFQGRRTFYGHFPLKP